MIYNNSLTNVSVRLVEEPPILSNTVCNNTRAAIDAVRSYLKDMDREVFGVLCLKSSGVPICFSTISVGSLNAAYVSMRDIMKVTVLSNACSIIAFHCHPSGQVTPSASDNEVTNKLRKACKLMEINLFDHIIVGCGSGEYYSYNEHGGF